MEGLGVVTLGGGGGVPGVGEECDPPPIPLARSSTVLGGGTGVGAVTTGFTTTVDVADVVTTSLGLAGAKVFGLKDIPSQFRSVVVELTAGGDSGSSVEEDPFLG